MKKGSLILSYNINEPNWQRTVWGTPSNEAGRLVRAAAVILERNIDLAIISGGAGWVEGKSEAQYMKERLYQGLEDLKEFTIYPILQKVSPKEIRRKLDKVLTLEEKAKNTAEHMPLVGEMFRRAGVREVTLVTSPDHISRALRDALICWQKDYPELVANVYGTPCVTLYSERTPEDVEIAKVSNVVIAEPPVMKKFNLARMFGVLGNPEALAEIDAVLKKHGK